MGRYVPRSGWAEHAKATAEKQQSITLVNQSFDERKIVVLRSDASDKTAKQSEAGYPRVDTIFVNTSAFSGTDSHTRAEILPDRLACELGSGILQTLCHGLQDFARKLLVRYGASHTDRTDQRAIGQDCL